MKLMIKQLWLVFKIKHFGTYLISIYDGDTNYHVYKYNNQKYYLPCLEIDQDNYSKYIFEQGMLIKEDYHFNEVVHAKIIWRL